MRRRTTNHERRAADTRAGRPLLVQSRRYKGGVLAWAHTFNYNSVGFVMAHAWYAPTYFSTFFSVAAEFILRVYVQQLHFVLNSPIHRRNAHHKSRDAGTRAWRELPAQTLESKRPEVVSHSFFAHKKAFIHYSTRYNVSITLVFARSDLFGYPPPGSRDLNLPIKSVTDHSGYCST
jgi:hypothetical protein